MTGSREARSSSPGKRAEVLTFPQNSGQLIDILEKSLDRGPPGVMYKSFQLRLVRGEQPFHEAVDDRILAREIVVDCGLAQASRLRQFVHSRPVNPATTKQVGRRIKDLRNAFVTDIRLRHGFIQPTVR